VQQYSSNEVSNDAWVTTRVAAAALGVKPQKVRNYIANGELEAITEGEGTKRRYLVSISSLENLYAGWHSEGKLPGQNRDGAQRLAASEQEEAPVLVRELGAELGEARYRLGQAEARLELMAEAESALRAQLQRERERADRLETERERLLPDLMREKDRVNAERERAEHLEAQLREALEVRRGWFRRFFGF
jgi:chromosome segregation ATPase